MAVPPERAPRAVDALRPSGRVHGASRHFSLFSLAIMSFANAVAALGWGAALMRSGVIPGESRGP